MNKYEQEGYDANLAGKDGWKDNPYTDPYQAHCWRHGWESAEREDEDSEDPYNCGGY